MHEGSRGALLPLFPRALSIVDWCTSSIVLRGVSTGTLARTEKRYSAFYWNSSLHLCVIGIVGKEGPMLRAGVSPFLC